MKNLTFERERATLCSYAFFSENTAGRLHPISECGMRTEFGRDRDRIIHSKSFRRLMHKMQVFLAPEGDHYRTRLTHTLEVSQIARTISRSLRLNEDLTEAIALGHDLGHTPFGHSGERALNRLCPGGFKHYEQSIRVIDVLENLNLTLEVRDGIRNHSDSNRAATLEGQVVKFADRIAYINHDIDDAIRAGLLTSGSIPDSLTAVLGNTHSKRISTMVSAVINYGVGEQIGMTEPYLTATEELRAFMFENVYFNNLAKSEDEKVVVMIAQLYDYFVEHTEKLPEEYKRNIAADGVEVSVCDYIACMTDRFALSVYEEIFIPRIWQSKK